MFEGAKPKGAGASTIAGAGAVLGIGKASSSLIVSVARNPYQSMAKLFFGNLGADRGPKV